MISYFQDSYPILLEALLEHMQLVYVSLLIALVIAVVVIYFFLKNDRWLNRLVYFFSALYSVPSYALFALLIPLTGLGTTSAIIVLVLYSEYILLRNFITGIKEIDPVIVESAIAMGMTEQQLFKRIQIPLAAPAIFSGIRITLTSVTGIATIASTINAGGLGRIIFDGLRTQSLVKMLWGALLAILLIIISNILLQLIEKYTLRNYALK